MIEFIHNNVPSKLRPCFNIGKPENETSFDGVGVRARALTTALQLLTGIEGLHRGTFVPLAPALARNGLGALAPTQRWCPAHFQQWQANGEDPFIPLSWRITAAGYCAEHNVRLEDQCPRCGVLQSLFPSRLRLDYCNVCGESLANFPIKKDIPGLGSIETDVAIWISRQITLTLADKQYGRVAIQDGVVANFFTQLELLHGLPRTHIANRIGLNPETLSQWRYAKTNPRIDMLLATLAELSVPFLLLLWAPRLAASQAILQAQARRTIVSSRIHVVRQPRDKRLIRKDVRKLLVKLKRKPTLKAVAKRLNIPQGTMHQLAGDLFRRKRR